MRPGLPGGRISFHKVKWNPSSGKTRTRFFLHIKYHSCWWPGDSRSQGISSNDLVIPVLAPGEWTTIKCQPIFLPTIAQHAEDNLDISKDSLLPPLLPRSHYRLLSMSMITSWSQVYSLVGVVINYTMRNCPEHPCNDIITITMASQITRGLIQYKNGILPV